MQQDLLPFTAPVNYREDTFIVSKSNQLAYDWVRLWPEWPTFGLVIHGPKHSGTTHLGHIWASKNQACYLDSRNITLDNIAPFFEQRTLLAIDNFDIISTEQAEALFHLFNHQKKQNQSLLILTHTRPQDWSALLPDLTSRLNTLTIANITAPDDVLMQGILIKKFSDAQLSITPQALAYLILRIERTYESLDHWVNAIDRASLIYGRQISIPLIKTISEGESS